MKKLSQLVSYFDSKDVDGGNLYPHLTQDQQIIHDSVLREFDNKSIRFAVLDAKSGSGKTTTIRAIVKSAERMKLNVVVTATTGKASSALGGQTIHSYLGMKMTPNDGAVNIDEALILKSSDIQVGSPDILIIDESSMMGNDLFREIKKHHFKYVLFVLDSQQLPPVKAVAVEWDKISQSNYYLYKTLRAQDADMINLFEDFKDYREGKKDNLDINDYVNGRNIIKIDYSQCDFIPKNSDSCCVHYRNKLVEFMADKVTIKGHNKYNLNASVQVTKMVVNGKTDKNGYPKRDFKSDIMFYNGEDVKIDILSNETSALQKNGVCMFKNWKLSISKSGNGITVNDMKGENDDDIFYIQFAPDQIMDHCSLAIIENKYFILIWDSGEEEYKQVLADLFAKLSPILRVHNQFKKYVENKISVNDLDSNLAYLARKYKDMEDFKQAYEDSEISMDRRRAWSEFMSAKNVVSARYTTSRTIHKSQGISVPCIVITNNSFYGASRAAEYVGITRSKHGIILIDNVPNIIKEGEQENEESFN